MWSLFFVLQVVAPPSPAELPSIFGVKLGAPISLPACRYLDDRPDIGYDINQPVMCATKPEAAPQFGRPWPYSTIWFPINTAPLIMKNFNLRAIIQDGHVASIEFYTPGVSGQEAVLAELTTKFGKPTTLVRSSDQTSRVADFVVIHATWKGAGYTVRFDGVDDRPDFGLVKVDTPEGERIRAVADKSDQASRPAL